MLDIEYLQGLRQFDIVYSLGMLNHTRQMWQALLNAYEMVQSDGILYIAIYNDQGWISKYLARVKIIYNKGLISKATMMLLHVPDLFWLRYSVQRLIGRLSIKRVMSLWVDNIDWLGGYPLEVATPDAVFSFSIKKILYWKP